MSATATNSEFSQLARRKDRTRKRAENIGKKSGMPSLNYFVDREDHQAIPTSEEDYDGNRGQVAATRTTKSSKVAFWLLGLLNNSGYVIMLASAKSISDGGTGMVFLANVLPSMCVKLSAPYWFDRCSYGFRMILGCACLILSFGLVASLADAPPSETTFGLRLLGVALGSTQCGIGEASLLAAAGYCDATGEGTEVSYFSSGTGLAGVFGFLWKYVWADLLEFGLSTTLWLAQSLSISYISVFWIYLRPLLNGDRELDTSTLQEEELPLELTTYRDHQHPSKSYLELNQSRTREATAEPLKPQDGLESGQADYLPDSTTEDNHYGSVHSMSLWERSCFVTSLWPYIIPLFVVYAAEYSLQAGAWTAIGFPVTSAQARNDFYEFSNWMYQAGVFVSRSSGSLGTVSMSLLWLMPAIQVFNVLFFTFVASSHVFYNYGLLSACFFVGLLGGAVYVHGYKRICSDFTQIDRRELALATTSVAESFGIVCASIIGLYLQACLYQVNGLEGAAVSCPF